MSLILRFVLCIDFIGAFCLNAVFGCREIEGNRLRKEMEVIVLKVIVSVIEGFVYKGKLKSAKRRLMRV